MAARTISRACIVVGLHKSRRLTMTGHHWSSVTQTCGHVVDAIQSVISRFYGTGQPQKTFTVAVEGNIGSGKTTLLRHFAGTPCAEVLQEPVTKWRNIEGQNALAKMYQDPKRWSLTFQTYVQLTMLETHLAKQDKPVKLMERSIYSAMYCFAENLHNSEVMPDIEHIVLKRWFDWIVQNNDCHLDLIVYLQTTPQKVQERIKQRCRKEEKTIPLDYLQSLHDLHEEWLIKQTKFPLPCPVLVLDGNLEEPEMIKLYKNHEKQILGGYS